MMENMMRAIVLITFVTLVLCGCQNTVRGFGQDMQHTGQEIQKSVNEKN